MQADKFTQLPTEKILWFFRKKNGAKQKQLQFRIVLQKLHFEKLPGEPNYVAMNEHA